MKLIGLYYNGMVQRGALEEDTGLQIVLLLIVCTAFSQSIVFY